MGERMDQCNGEKRWVSRRISGEQRWVSRWINAMVSSDQEQKLCGEREREQSVARRQWSETHG